jgi:hypothetical protein
MPGKMGCGNVGFIGSVTRSEINNHRAGGPIDSIIQKTDTRHHLARNARFGPFAGSLRGRVFPSGLAAMNGKGGGGSCPSMEGLW